jgi:hypothetical protein
MARTTSIPSERPRCGQQENSTRPANRRPPPGPFCLNHSVGLWYWLALACLGPACPAHAAAELVRSEYEVKAAFLHKFALFVEWPAQPPGEAPLPLVVGVLGQNPFGTNLQAVLSSKTVRGRPLTFRHFQRVDEAIKTGCHLLFIAPSEKGRLQSVLTALRSRPILTVSDTPGFGELGVMINLLTRDNRLGFEINQGAAGEAGLRLSSQVLDLALDVRSPPGPPRK